MFYLFFSVKVSNFREETKLTTDMRKFTLLLAAFCLCAVASAQQALGPGSGLVSPQINPDNTVTFRYHAPKAITVQLTGDFLEARITEIEMGSQGNLTSR